jgi:hypothetical protein
MLKATIENSPEIPGLTVDLSIQLLNDNKSEDWFFRRSLSRGKRAWVPEVVGSEKDGMRSRYDGVAALFQDEETINAGLE